MWVQRTNFNHIEMAFISVCIAPKRTIRAQVIYVVKKQSEASEWLSSPSSEQGPGNQVELCLSEDHFGTTRTSSRKRCDQFLECRDKLQDQSGLQQQSPKEHCDSSPAQSGWASSREQSSTLAECVTHGWREEKLAGPVAVAISMEVPQHKLGSTRYVSESKNWGLHPEGSPAINSPPVSSFYLPYIRPPKALQLPATAANQGSIHTSLWKASHIQTIMAPQNRKPHHFIGLKGPAGSTQGWVRGLKERKPVFNLLPCGFRHTQKPWAPAARSRSSGKPQSPKRWRKGSRKGLGCPEP